MTITQLEIKLEKLQGQQILERIQNQCGIKQLKQLFGENAITHNKKKIYQSMLISAIMVAESK